MNKRYPPRAARNDDMPGSSPELSPAPRRKPCNRSGPGDRLSQESVPLSGARAEVEALPPDPNMKLDREDRLSRWSVPLSGRMRNLRRYHPVQEKTRHRESTHSGGFL